jgi:hypothetical protein
VRCPRSQAGKACSKRPVLWFLEQCYQSKEQNPALSPIRSLAGQAYCHKGRQQDLCFLEYSD